VIRVTYHQRASDGRWFARLEGVDRYTGEPYVYWRPHYPPVARSTYARDWEGFERETRRKYHLPTPDDLPRPQLPARPASFDEQWVVRKMTNAADALRGAGFEVDLQAAVDPSGVRRVALRGVMKPRLAVVLFWWWRPAGMSKMRGQDVWREGEWVNDDAYVRAAAGMPVRTGRTSHTEALRSMTV